MRDIQVHTSPLYSPLEIWLNWVISAIVRFASKFLKLKLGSVSLGTTGIFFLLNLSARLFKTCLETRPPSDPLETTKDGSIGDGDALFVVCPAADIYQGIDIIYMLKSPGICSF